ncbi:MAG: cytochrome c3 family protein [Candidatus Kryptoniota bacterium]
MKKILLVLTTAAGFVTGVFLVGKIIDNRDRVVQPIDFSHAVHAGKFKIPCMACHQHVLTGARAGIPNIEVCSACHFTPLKGTPEEKLVYDYVTEHKQIPWYSIYYVPDYAYFSHRRHVGIGKIECKECHGNVATLTSPPSKQFLQIKMNNCLNCHTENHITTDCSHCHR